MDLVLKNLAPGRTASIQLYQRGTNTTVGSPIAGSSSVYTYTFPNVPVGYYDYELIGFTAFPSSRRALRVTTTAVYEAANWWEIETAIPENLPVVPSPVAGLCNVLFAITHNGDAVLGAIVTATLDQLNNTVDNYLASRSVDNGETDEDGLCTLRLIQFGQFTRGGSYRIRVTDTKGIVHQDRLVTIPNATTANAEDLPDAA